MKFGDTFTFTDADTGKEYTAEFMDHMELTNDYNYDCDVEVDEITYSLYYHIEDEVLYCTVKSYDLHSDEVKEVLVDIESLEEKELSVEQKERAFDLYIKAELRDEASKLLSEKKKNGEPIVVNLDEEWSNDLLEMEDEEDCEKQKEMPGEEFPWSIDNYDMILLEEGLQMMIGYFREQSNDTKEYDWNFVPSLKAHVLTGFDKTDEKDQECIKILRKHLGLYGRNLDDDLIVRKIEE